MCSAFIPCRFERCQMRSSVSPLHSSSWTSSDHSCSCSGVSLLIMTLISVLKPQPESPSVAKWIVTPAVPSSPPAFPSRYSQPASCRETGDRVSVLWPGGAGGSPYPGHQGTASQSRPRGTDHSFWSGSAHSKELSPDVSTSTAFPLFPTFNPISFKNMDLFWRYNAKTTQTVPGL